jgi:cystathionine beta-lyase/cystathionine gamma-synthase
MGASSSDKGRGVDTLLVHAGEPRPRIARSVVTPIFQSSTYEMAGDADYHDILYARLSNSPNHDVLHRKLAALEGGEAALVAASGMAAISATLLAIVRPGDHLILQDCLYGGTHDFITQDLAALGVEHTFVGGASRDAWRSALRPTTRAFYCEALTNPLLGVADLGGIAAFCRRESITSIIDATFATPIQLRPLDLGFDVVVHSATKYLNGHSDITAGAVIGRASFVRDVKRKLDHLGGSLDPHACFLLHRGLRTLGLRVRHQAATAAALARALEGHREVARVLYPGLASHPDHARAAELLTGFGAMVAFETKGGAEYADAAIGRLELAVDAPSLGGPETLVTRPAKTSHAGLGSEARRRAGISDGLVRVSVGLEDAKDLVGDFVAALG